MFQEAGSITIFFASVMVGIAILGWPSPGVISIADMFMPIPKIVYSEATIISDNMAIQVTSLSLRSNASNEVGALLSPAIVVLIDSAQFIDYLTTPELVRCRCANCA